MDKKIILAVSSPVLVEFENQIQSAIRSQRPMYWRNTDGKLAISYTAADWRPFLCEGYGYNPEPRPYLSGIRLVDKIGQLARIETDRLKQQEGGRYRIDNNSATRKIENGPEICFKLWLPNRSVILNEETMAESLAAYFDAIGKDSDDWLEQKRADGIVIDL